MSDQKDSPIASPGLQRVKTLGLASGRVRELDGSFGSPSYPTPLDRVRTVHRASTAGSGSAKRRSLAPSHSNTSVGSSKTDASTPAMTLQGLGHPNVALRYYNLDDDDDNDDNDDNDSDRAGMNTTDTDTDDDNADDDNSTSASHTQQRLHHAVDYGTPGLPRLVSRDYGESKAPSSVKSTGSSRKRTGKLGEFIDDPNVSALTNLHNVSTVSSEADPLLRDSFAHDDPVMGRLAFQPTCRVATAPAGHLHARSKLAMSTSSLHSVPVTSTTSSVADSSSSGGSLAAIAEPSPSTQHRRSSGPTLTTTGSPRRHRTPVGVARTSSPLSSASNAGSVTGPTRPYSVRSVARTRSCLSSSSSFSATRATSVQQLHLLQPQRALTPQHQQLASSLHSIRYSSSIGHGSFAASPSVMQERILTSSQANLSALFSLQRTPRTRGTPTAAAAAAAAATAAAGGGVGGLESVASLASSYCSPFSAPNTRSNLSPRVINANHSFSEVAAATALQSGVGGVATHMDHLNVQATAKNPFQAVLTVLADGSLLTANMNACHFFGLATDDVDCVSLSEILVPEHAEMVLGRLAAAASAAHDEAVAVAAGRTSASLESLTSSGTNEVSQPVIMSGVVVDAVHQMTQCTLPISLWVRRVDSEYTSASVRASGLAPPCRFIVVIEHVQRLEASLLVDSSSIVRDSSENAPNLFGYDEQIDLIGHSLDQFIPAVGGLPTVVSRKDSTCLSSAIDMRHPYSTVALLQDGSAFPAEVTFVGSGVPDSDVRVSLIVYANMSGLVTCDLHGTILSANDQFAKLMFGYKADELEGMSMQSIIPDFPVSAIGDQPRSDCRSHHQQQQQQQHRPASQSLSSLSVTSDDDDRRAPFAASVSRSSLSAVAIPEHHAHTEHPSVVRSLKAEFLLMLDEEGHNHSLNDAEPSAVVHDKDHNDTNLPNTSSRGDVVAAIDDSATALSSVGVSPALSVRARGGSVGNTVRPDGSRSFLVTGSSGSDGTGGEKGEGARQVTRNLSSLATSQSPQSHSLLSHEKSASGSTPSSSRVVSALESIPDDATVKDSLSPYYCSDGGTTPMATTVQPAPAVTSTMTSNDGHDGNSTTFVEVVAGACDEPALVASTPKHLTTTAEFDLPPNSGRRELSIHADIHGDTGSIDQSVSCDMTDEDDEENAEGLAVRHRVSRFSDTYDAEEEANYDGGASALVSEGMYRASARHRDGGPGVRVLLQIKLVHLDNSSVPQYCCWISRDLSAAVDENPTNSSAVLPPPDAHRASFTESLMNASMRGTSILSREAMVEGEFNAAYETKESIGKGAFGQVKLAERRSDQRLAVVKFIAKSQMDVPEMPLPASTMPLEAQILRALDHENIVRLLDVYQNDTFVQIVMERHGDGMDLFEYIDIHPEIPELVCSLVFRQLASAVGYLHDNMILHRDIKDENIIIDNDFRIKLIDFGSATTFEEGKLFGTFCGTVEYCSPEVLLGNHYQGPELEIWSMGVTLYTMVFGENPFFDVDETIAAELRPPFEASSDCMDLLAWILDPNPEERILMEEIYAHPWTTLETDAEGLRRAREALAQQETTTDGGGRGAEEEESDEEDETGLFARELAEADSCMSSASREE